MTTFFVLVLLQPGNPLLLPHPYETAEACNQAAFSHKDSAERYACVKFQIINDEPVK